MPPSLCQSLAQTVHNKTGGIILFVRNYLKALNEEGLLRYNLTTDMWEYNKEQIQQKAMNEDGISHYLTLQMSRLEPQVRLALQVASCFGFTIDAETLQAALLGIGIQFTALNEIVFNGFLHKLPTQYAWAHDVVHCVSHKKASFIYHIYA